MSAWLVSEFHINAIVSWAAREGVPFVHYRTKEKAACALVAENMRSLNHRYRGEKFTKEWQEQAATYNFKSVSQEELKTFIKRTNAERNSERSIGNKLPPLTNEVIATQIIKACDCYHYQACEHDGYSDSDAHDFIELVKQAADRAGGQGDGKVYDQMLWGLDLKQHWDEITLRVAVAALVYVTWLRYAPMLTMGATLAALMGLGLYLAARFGKTIAG